MFCFSIYCLCFIGKIQCIEGVAIGAVCYKLPYRVGPGVNFTQADAICRYRGGELAEIPTEQVYNTVYEYIKQSSYYTINGKSINNAIIHIWLGSSYNVSKYCILSFLFFKIEILPRFFGIQKFIKTTIYQTTVALTIFLLFLKRGQL